MAFLEQSRSNTWDYVLRVVRLCVMEDGHIVAEDGQPVASSAVPTGGKYKFITASGTVTLRPGPEGKSKAKPPTGTSVSTMSNSARSSVDQSAFRVRVIARDFSCLLTGVGFDRCVASHIIPFSREDVWSSFAVSHPFTASCGLLLASDLHTLYDNYRWSLYNPGDSTLVVHFFAPSEPSEFAFHGKVIPRDRFRVHSEQELPDPRFLAWHYQQCVQLNIRGFYVPR